MTDRERVEEIRFFLKFNKKTFSEVLGYTTPQSYTSYLNGSNNLSMKMIKALKKYDSRISIDWIMEGQGEMLITGANSNSQKIINGDGNITQIAKNSNNTTNSNNSNTMEIEYLKKENEQLKQAIKDKEEIIQLLKR